MGPELSIENALPHGPRFRLIDRVVEWSALQRARTITMYAGRAEWLEAHDGTSTVSPAALIEQAAQTALLLCAPRAEHAAIPALGRVEAEFFEMVEATVPVEAEAVITFSGWDAIAFDAELRTDGRLIGTVSGVAKLQRLGGSS
jgi:predicted hotdog family 3-hydroxylacyl-ACP dehydratase